MALEKQGELKEKVDFHIQPPHLSTFLWLALLLAATATRLWDLGARTMSHDEALHAYYSWRLYAGEGYLHNPVTHGPFLFHINALVYGLFGATDATARLAPALFGVALVGLPLLLRRWLGHLGAFASGLMLLVSPVMLYYSRYIRNDLFVAIWSLLMVAALFQFVVTQNQTWFWVGGLATVLALCTKEISLIFGFISLVFLSLAWARERIRPRTGRRARTVGWVLVLLLIAACIGGRTAPLEGGSQTRAILQSAVPYALFVLGLLVSVLLTLPRLPREENGWHATLTAVQKRTWVGVLIAGTLIFVLLHTTFLTNVIGLVSGTVGAISYWLAQQGVQRGNQPWYYYAVTLSLYEFLPLLFGGLGLIRFWFIPRAWRAETKEERIFVTFLVFWLLTSLTIYSWAGEKMPWLTVHLVLPLIFLSGWELDRALSGADGAALIRRGALPLGLLLTLLAYLALMLLGISPFQGWSVWNLAATGQWLLMVAAGLFSLWLTLRIARRMGRRVAGQVALVTLFLGLGLLTMRFAWMASFINDDTPLEYLVYAHSSADVKRTMCQIEAISLHQTGERELPVLYDDDVRWVFQWYLRDYPNAEMFGRELEEKELAAAPVVLLGSETWEENALLLEDEYLRREARLLWWPLEDRYRDLTPHKIGAALRDPEARQRVWDLFWFRRYESKLSNWPLRHDYALFIRKDLAMSPANSPP